MKRRGIDSIESWIVAIAGSVVFLLAACPMRLGGQLFVSILDHFQTSRKEASFPFAIATLMTSVSGPFAGYAGEIFGLRAVTIIGCIFCVTGVGGCFFAQKIIEVDASLGLIYGIGYGWTTAVIPEIISFNFDKHRAKGQSIVFGGSSVGAFIIPPLLELILFEFGMSGTFLIISGFVLHSIPAAMLLSKRKPDSTYNLKLYTVGSDTSYKMTFGTARDCHSSLAESKTLTEQIPNSTDSGILSVVKPSNANEYNVVSANRSTNLNISLQKEAKSNILHPKSYIRISSFKTILESEKLENEVSGIDRNTLENTANASQCLKETLQHDAEKQNGYPKFMNALKISCELNEDNKKQKRFCEKNSSKSFYNIIKILWNPTFLMVSFIVSAHFYVMYICWTIIVDVIRDKGIEQSQEVYFVMAVSFLDTVGRFTLTSVTDCGYITNLNFSAACFAGMGLSCLLLTLVSGFYPTMIAVCSLGLMYGGNTPGLPGIVSDTFSEDIRSMAMASRAVLYVPMSFTMSPLIGYFRENLGSYNGLLYVMTAICIVCTITLVLLPKFVKNKTNCSKN